MDIESESLQFDNGSIYVQFGVNFIMLSDIFFYSLYPSYEGFSVTVDFIIIVSNKRYLTFESGI